MKERADLWDRVYGARPATQVSWYAPRLNRSLAMIRAVAGPSSKVIDVGGGASTLADDLLALGYANVTVLDVSRVALEAARRHLGARTAAVEWIVGDVTALDLPAGAYDVWHDRAVFHFLTAAPDRRSYAERAARSLRAGGHAVLATFSPEGPPRCSGLDVVRYDARSLSRELGPAFALRQEASEIHRTPAGAAQAFTYCLFEKVGSAGGAVPA